MQHDSSADADLGLGNVGSCPGWRFTGGHSDLIAYDKTKMSDIASAGRCLKPARFWPFADMCSMISDNITLQGRLLRLQVRLLADPSQASNPNYFEPDMSTAGPTSVP